MAHDTQNEIRRLFQQKEKDLQDEEMITSIDAFDGGRKVKVYFTGGAITKSSPTEEFSSVYKRVLDLISKDTQIIDLGTTYLYRLNQPESDRWFVTPIHPRTQTRVYFHLEGFELCEKNGIIDCWKKLAKKISVDYEKYDGFLVIHWLRNMEYTATAISFMLQNLRKPIIFTGGLRSLGSLNNDSSPNISGALVFAGNFRIPEVCIFQHDSLFRANRTICQSANTADCFSSPNLKPLALLDRQVTLNWDTILVPPPMSSKTSNVKLNATLEPNISRLYLATSMSEDLIKQAFFGAGVKAVLVEAFGKGNIPTNSIVHKCIEQAAEKGVLTFIVSQCHKGSVTDTGPNTALEFGAISCGNMVPAAAFIKIAQIMTINPSYADARELISDTSKGDISEMGTSDSQLSQLGAIENSLQIMIKRYPGTNYNLVAKHWLMPSIFFNAVRKGLIGHVKSLLQSHPSLFFEKDSEQNNIFHMIGQCPDDKTAEQLVKFALTALESYKDKITRLGMTSVAQTTRNRPRLSSDDVQLLKLRNEGKLKAFSDRFVASMLDIDDGANQTEKLSLPAMSSDDLLAEQAELRPKVSLQGLSPFAKAAEMAKTQPHPQTDNSTSGLEFERMHTPLSSYLHKHNAYGQSPLRVAIQRKRIGYVMKLKRLGAHFTEEELVEAKAIILDAAREGNLQIIMLHYYAGVDALDSITDMDGRNIAHIAAFMGHLEILVFLRNETDFDLRKPDSYGNTPLDEAAFSPSPEVARLLDD